MKVDPADESHGLNADLVAEPVAAEEAHTGGAEQNTKEAEAKKKKQKEKGGQAPSA